MKFLRSPILKSLITTAVLSFGLITVSAQIIQPTDEQLSSLDERLETYMESNNIPGALVAIVSRGEVIHLETYGMANVELSVPVTDDTVFEIGSISKQFVSAAVMLLVEENKLELDDAIENYIADIPSEWLGVTVRQLMNHTSGIPDYEEIASYDIYGERVTPEEIIQIAHSRPMDFAPGTGWYYSNTGYFLLSMIVERVEGQPLGRVLKSRIFDPVGMTQTRLADPEAIIEHRAAGYWVNKSGELINRRPTETSSTLGAGGILSSVYDLMKWDEVLFGEELLSADSKAQMWERTRLPNGDLTRYGFGWFLNPYNGLQRQYHSGQVAGFVAQFARFTEDEISVIMFVNRYRVNTGPVWQDVLHTYMPSLGEL
jgi:D-alanyl-D-alanine carboxypeptidase